MTDRARRKKTENRARGRKRGESAHPRGDSSAFWPRACMSSAGILLRYDRKVHPLGCADSVRVPITFARYTFLRALCRPREASPAVPSLPTLRLSHLPRCVSCSFRGWRCKAGGIASVASVVAGGVSFWSSEYCRQSRERVCNETRASLRSNEQGLCTLAASILFVCSWG